MEMSMQLWLMIIRACCLAGMIYTSLIISLRMIGFFVELIVLKNAKINITGSAVVFSALCGNWVFLGWMLGQ